MKKIAKFILKEGTFMAVSKEQAAKFYETMCTIRCFEESVKKDFLNGEIPGFVHMNLSLTADHRVVDGSVAAEFLQRVKTLLENPALILA